MFKDLGLLVVDEEQRFGVQAKEAMKKLCKERYQQFGCEGQASRIRPLSTAAP